VRKLLREFFEAYQGSLIFHNATYDISAMIVQLWMEDLLDTNGLLKGLEILTRDFHDTKIIAYLATNTTADNTLKLKELAHAFAGNWANDDITDIRRIPLPELLSYNLVDGLSTHYVFNKYYPQMVADQQEELYLGLMLPSQKTLIQVEMTGMPMDPAQVQIARKELEAILKAPQEVFKGSALVRKTEELLRRRAWEKDFETRVFKAKKPEKIKPKNWDTFPGKPYNPSSGLQTRTLLYEVAGLPVIDLTKTKQPAVGGETLEKLKYHAQSPDVLAVVEALIEFSSATKILDTFIPAFEKAIHKGDDVVWLHGNFNLGGTVSGRLSSSNPNLQNLPAGSKYGKLVKKCFKAPDGWIFCGADFNALEARINALLTNDPNKLEVYLSGLDSHSWNTLGYWPDKMPEIAAAVAKTALPGKYFKVTYDDNTVTCYHEGDPEFSQLQAQS
jgi:DNA polymerase-1